MAASGPGNYTIAAEAAAEIVSQKLKILLSCPEWVECSPIKTLVKDAKDNLAKIQEFFSIRDRLSQSPEWSGRLFHALYDAEEFIDKFYLKVARRRHEALHVASRPLQALVHKYMLWKDLSNLVKVIKELCEDQYLIGKERASSSHAKVPWGGPKLTMLTGFWDRQASMDFLFHENEKQKIMERITAKEAKTGVHGISIYGKQGTGKTFLARWVYEKAMYLGFDVRAWVHVSAGMDKQEFLFEILKQVDKLARDVMNLYEIGTMLRQKLAKTKGFLIVLDDVRLSDQQLLRELLMIIPFPSQGHIITTTREESIARSMSTPEPKPDDTANAAQPKPIKLKKLENLNDSKTMLATMLHSVSHVLSHTPSQKMLATKSHGVSNDLSLTPEEEKILKRFPALPLYISLLGGLLPSANVQERAALASDDTKMSESDLIELSYHRLPAHLKPCFIYMALFPVASPISTRRLVRLWLAEGLLDSHCCDEEWKRTPEDVGETFIVELADRNVIDVVSWRADGSPKTCQMLTSLYDVIRPTVMSTGFLYVHEASKSKGRSDRNSTGQQQQPLDASRERTKVRWLAEHTNIVKDGHGNSYPNPNLSQVRSFLSFYLRRGMLTKDISTLLTNMTSKADYSLLRVLDLEGVYKPSLQGVLHKLVLLRYLGLRSTALDSIPSEVVDLHYLETLDIKHTNITSLPSSLWKARNLRHLHLNWFYMDLKKILKAGGDNVMALTKLQTLSGLVIGEVKEISMTGLMNSLITLKLFLQHSDNDTSSTTGKTVARWISVVLINLQSLTFGVIQEAKPAKETEAVKDATQEAKPMQEPKPAKETEPAKDAKLATSQIGPLPELSLAQHHELLELYLLGQLNKPIWTQLLPGSLRVLTLSGSMVETHAMTQLGDLLKNLRTFKLLANSFLGTTLTFAKNGFPSLMILKIWKLPQLTKVIIEEGAMPHLKELEFRYLNSMETVEGLDKCEKLENLGVIYQKDAKSFVDYLEHHLEQGKRKTYLYKREETEVPESIDDNA